MDIHRLKEAHQDPGNSDVRAVFFEPPDKYGANRDKDYPVVVWDESSIEFVTNPRADGANPETTYTINAFIFDYFDEQSLKESRSRTEIWRDLVEKFTTYLSELNRMNTKLQVQEEEIEGEFYNRGIFSPDSEIGAGFRITIITWCV